jgi:hypothetical protein
VEVFVKKLSEQVSPSVRRYTWRREKDRSCSPAKWPNLLTWDAARDHVSPARGRGRVSALSYEGGGRWERTRRPPAVTSGGWCTGHVSGPGA